MSSKSAEKVTASTTNVAVDRRAVMESGTQIFDSIMTNNDPKVIDAALKNDLAKWKEMVTGNSLNLVTVTEMGNRIVEMAQKSQIKLDQQAFNTLKGGLDQFEALLGQNKLIVGLVGEVSSRAFDQAGSALDIVAEVKTADYIELSKMVLLFALAALWISKRKG